LIPYLIDEVRVGGETFWWGLLYLLSYHQILARLMRRNLSVRLVILRVGHSRNYNSKNLLIRVSFDYTFESLKL
jgi:hypothetical protein